MNQVPPGWRVCHRLDEEQGFFWKHVEVGQQVVVGAGAEGQAARVQRQAAAE